MDLAALVAAIDGPLHEPVFSGSATITDGRIRHFALPNSLDAINGVVRFDSRGLQLDDVTATVGGGRVQFGGRIGFEGYLVRPASTSAPAPRTCSSVVLEGVRSTVDDPTIRGNFMAPTVGGSITVKSATWSRKVDPTGGLLDIGGGRSSSAALVAAPASQVPVRLDIQVHVPSTLRVENNLARLVASADLQLRGTLDHLQFSAGGRSRSRPGDVRGTALSS